MHYSRALVKYTNTLTTPDRHFVVPVDCLGYQYSSCLASNKSNAKVDMVADDKLAQYENPVRMIGLADR